MAQQEEMTFKIEDARILFRNFAGQKTQYNAAGNRNFSVELDADTAAALGELGWNVKVLPAREEGDEERFYIQVALGYTIKPPRVTMVTSGGKVPLTEDMVSVLDAADIQKVDLIARAYHWEVGDKSGTKAYLKTLFVIIDEDDLERKYAVNTNPMVSTPEPNE